MCNLQERRYNSYKGKHIRITTDFSIEILKGKRSWSNVLQVLKDSPPPMYIKIPLIRQDSDFIPTNTHTHTYTRQHEIGKSNKDIGRVGVES